MAGKGTAMGVRLLAALSVDLSSVNVSELCRELGVSRQTFYKWRGRFAVEGPGGLVERSRRPVSSPNQMPVATEEEVVRLRKWLVGEGLDHGAQSIVWAMMRAGWGEVPSVSAVHRALVRRGMVVPQPQKRPRSAGRRFVWPFPNGAWQFDGTRWVLADGEGVWVMDCLDDHSRVVPAALACGGLTSEAAWETLCLGGRTYGLPANVMSDNGTCFTGRFGGGGDGRVLFEDNLAQAGINQILSSPGHPQTCGKLERFHQTLKQWLRARPLARNLEQLQSQLDEFRDYYNHQRPHRALRGATPQQAWEATPAARPGRPIRPQGTSRLGTVNTQGQLTVGPYLVGIGTHLAGHQVLIIRNDLDVTVIGNGQIIRRLTIDTTRRYQPSGRPPGRRPKNHTRTTTNLMSAIT